LREELGIRSEDPDAGVLEKSETPMAVMSAVNGGLADGAVRQELDQDSEHRADGHGAQENHGGHERGGVHDRADAERSGQEVGGEGPTM